MRPARRNAARTRLQKGYYSESVRQGDRNESADNRNEDDDGEATANSDELR
jgi:hypothetical protein